MIDWKKVTLEDRTWITEKLKEDNRSGCEYTFGNNYIWRDVYKVEAALLYDCCLIKHKYSGRESYAFPLGNGDKRRAVEALLEDTGARGVSLHFASLLAEDKEFLERYFPGEFRISAERDSFDYIYTTEKLTKLAGKKLHGKRNHIARFRDSHDWKYEMMSEENIPACMEMNRRWCEMNKERWNADMEQEQMAVKEAFRDFKELAFTGGVLYADGEVVGFTIGEPLNTDTFVVHIEKAFPQIQGAYPMINQQFVEHACQEYTYVNREEDTGAEGLRKAKLSYYPDILLEKYSAEAVCGGKDESQYADAVYEGKDESIRYADESIQPALKQIWKECFGDADAYIDFYFNNRFTDKNMLVYCIGKEPVSMLSLLPVTLHDGDNRLAAAYIYGVATTPKYRGHGYAGRLLAEAYHREKKPLLLQPADEKLSEYYKARGFLEAFRMQEYSLELPAVQAAGFPEKEEQRYWLLTVTPVEYKAIRDREFAGDGYVEWDEAAVAYALLENDFCDGYAYKVFHDGREDILLYRMGNDRMHILETTLTDNDILGVIKKLRMQPKEIAVRRPANRVQQGRSFALLYGAEKITDGYLNLTLE